MKGKTKKIVLAVAVIAAVAAGGVAFTQANVVTGPNTAGYASVTVSGADITDVHYTLDATGVNITDVDLTTTVTDLVADSLTVKIGFNGGSLTACTVTGAHAATCPVTGQTTAGATDLAVAVSH
jgi:hypothetical protein